MKMKTPVSKQRKNGIGIVCYINGNLRKLKNVFHANL